MDINIDEMLKTFEVIEEYCPNYLGVATKEFKLGGIAYCNNKDCFNCWKHALKIEKDKEKIIRAEE